MQEWIDLYHWCEDNGISAAEARDLVERYKAEKDKQKAK